jgi:cytochrome c-type biogenesis protein CcmF
LDRSPSYWLSFAESTLSAAGIAAIITRKPLLIKSARNAGMAVCVLVWLGSPASPIFSSPTTFSMAYVVEHSNRTLPTFLKIPAIWAGQQGSLLFWSFLLSIYVFSACLSIATSIPS